MVFGDENKFQKLRSAEGESSERIFDLESRHDDDDDNETHDPFHVAQKINSISLDYIKLPNFNDYDFKSYLPESLQKYQVSLHRGFIKNTLRLLAGVVLAAIPILGWAYLAKRATFIAPGELGVARDTNGNIELYEPGWHIPLGWYSDIEKVNLVKDRNVTKHGRFNLVNVEPTEYGLAHVNNDPVILKPGRYVLPDDASFRFSKHVKQEQTQIEHGQLHIITVAPGQIAYAEDLEERIALKEGRHFVQSETFQYKGSVPKNTPVIEFGSGKNSYRWITVSPNERVIVYQPNTQSSTQQGEFKVFGAGSHFLDDPLQVIKARISLSQDTLEIPKRHLSTNDNVGIVISAGLLYKVTDPLKVIQELGANWKQDLCTQATNSLANIIGGSDMIDRTRSIDDHESSSQDSDHHQKESLRKAAHDKFLDDFKKKMALAGIEIMDIAVNDLEVTDKEVAQALASQAKQTALAKGRLDNAESNAKATLVEAEAKAKADKVVTVTHAEAESEALGIKTTAEASRMNELAKAKADSTRTIDTAVRLASKTTQDLMAVEAAGKAVKPTDKLLMLGNGNTLAHALGGVVASKVFEPKGATPELHRVRSMPHLNRGV